MSERYSRLFTLPENLYAVGSPVVIAAGTLLKDNQTGKIVAQLKLKSISPKSIKAVKVRLDLFDTAGKPIDEPVVYDYLDLNVSRDTEFGQKNPVMIPDIKARSYRASVTEVVFADRSVWTADGGSWEQLRKPSRLAFADYELQKQYEIKFGGGSIYKTETEKDLWYCACGALNRTGENCHICHHSLFELQTLDIAELTAEKDARLAEEARVEAERARQAAEELAARKAAADAAKQKTAKILGIAIPVICAIIAFAMLMVKVIIPNSKYNDAVALMEAEKYEEAIAAFKAIDGYKDSAEQIDSCEDAIDAAKKARIEAKMADEKVEKEAANAIAYHAAEKLAENGETAKAAIAFGKMAGYEDASEQSLALWRTILTPNTFDSGHFHTVGLQADGKLLAVGNNEYSQTDVQDWTDIKSISAGAYFTIGLKTDGSLVSTGINNVGQCDIQGWTDIQSVSAGAYHTVGLKSDGTVVAAGYNEKDNRCEVDDWKDIVAISSGQYHTVGLKFDGTVSAVGYNADKQCNVSGWQDIVAISAGSWHTVGLKVDGTVIAIGNNAYGQCDVSGWRDIIAVSAGKVHTVGLKSDGTVVATGHNEYGQCDVSAWKNIIMINSDNCHTIGLRADGTVVAAGSNDYGQCNVSRWEKIKLPN